MEDLSLGETKEFFGPLKKSLLLRKVHAVSMQE